MKNNKFISGKASILVLAAVLAVSAFLIGKSLTKVSAFTTVPSCVSTGAQCGTDNGTQPGTVYTDFIGNCPAGYHYQNDGNWDQRCHRNTDTPHDGNVPPEHQAPTETSCPETYTKSGSDENTVCSKIAQVACHTGIIQHDSCEVTIDVCSNLDGNQETLPDGMQVNSDHFCSCKDGYHEVNSEGLKVSFDGLANFTCVADVPVQDPDVCTNIDGIQTSVPDGMHINSTGHECENWGQSGPAPRNDEGTGTSGQVLGASTTNGQVLGASTMAGTGSFEETIFQAIMSIGATLSAFGLKGLKKAKKASTK